MKARALLLASFLFLIGVAAFAQSVFVTPGGQYAPVPMCNNGSNQWVPCTTANPLPVSLLSTPVATEEVPFSYQNITTSTTTVVKSGSGTLHAVNINSLGTVASSIQVYDNTSASGSLIATINSLSVLGTMTFDVQFGTGLTIVTTGVLAPNVTISYR
jgi:hypothetical protein